ncbi:tripartite tricarboxylate transporter TctB family protein [Paenibacillus radicis (ex Xue et al. 2023)]|uniref:Tripartite tricarboxylate transporter TctB family protein n=1 Tax=Paenibacillus radicis (ex Xue et al. 2023) TaxID=2972489 RepID=A0ABT1YSH0_9BACL|nr:tripartite tricarboxylate transporter TctB family protein [Paenibacillus radicis (ex Xue et al. 2023)]MCR8635675.1 tripartite tricarboxylate transporter TctB family protein [Paenibacillus radicis (ex Xue et al. 2023)]
MANKMFDRYASIAFLIIGAFFVVDSRNISQSAYGSSVGSDIFPLGLGLILILLSIRLFYENLRVKSDKSEAAKLDYKRFGIIFAAMVLYVFLLEKIGYVIATFLFLLIGFQTLERKKMLFSIIISAVISVGVYYVYVTVLQGTLPALPEWLGF